VARTAVTCHPVARRCALRARSWADGQAMPSRVRPRAIAVMPRPARYSP